MDVAEACRGDDQAGLTPARVVQRDPLGIRFGDAAETCMDKDKAELTNSPSYEFPSDLARLTLLNHRSIFHCLKHRYYNDMVYTYSGMFLVAINPYKWLPIYEQKDLDRYRRGNLDEPHIFSTGEKAYSQMMNNRENQSVLITGESGAGKTETTKKIVHYLVSRSGGQDDLEIKIVEANNILESFGNAQTTKNNNSSRFGKLVTMDFSTRGVLIGAHIQKYLLEKSRVTHLGPEERSFHVFYQLVKSMDSEVVEEHLDGSSLDAFRAGLRMANQSDKLLAKATEKDKQEFVRVLQSMKRMNFSSDEISDVLRVLTAIICLLSLEFRDGWNGMAECTTPGLGSQVASLLGIDGNQFLEALCRPCIKIGGAIIKQQRTCSQVVDSIHMFARELYDKTFDHLLLAKLNREMKGKESGQSIQVLDMFGFEIFEHNGFEQFCINYTNEKLQQFFNYSMFVQEQNEYLQENIEWIHTDFGKDLQPTIDMIEKTIPPGILSLLDEECLFPQGTDLSFTDKCTLSLKESELYEPIPYCSDGFKLRHYADWVTYQTSGWVNKNKDSINNTLIRLVATSRFETIAQLFRSGFKESSSFRTLTGKYREQLQCLVDGLYATHPHFIRCILPNRVKSPGELDSQLVIHQLQCNGVLEGLRLCRQGYPNRMEIGEFNLRYCWMMNVIGSSRVETARKILHAANMKNDEYRIGMTKIFFKTHVLGNLEQQREMHTARFKKQLVIVIRQGLHRFRTKHSVMRRMKDEIERYKQLHLAQVEATRELAESKLETNALRERICHLEQELAETQQHQILLLDRLRDQIDSTQRFLVQRQKLAASGIESHNCESDCQLLSTSPSLDRAGESSAYRDLKRCNHLLGSYHAEMSTQCPVE